MTVEDTIIYQQLDIFLLIILTSDSREHHKGNSESASQAVVLYLFRCFSDVH